MSLFHGFLTSCLCHSFLLRARTPLILLLLQCGDPPTGDSVPQSWPTWVFPRGCSSSLTVPVWTHLRCNPSGTACSSVGVPCGVTSPPSKPAPVQASLSNGLMILPESRMGFQQKHSILWPFTYFSMEFLVWLISAHCGSPWSSSGAAVESQLWHLLLLLHWSCCLQSCFSHCSHSSLMLQVVVQIFCSPPS